MRLLDTLLLEKAKEILQNLIQGQRIKCIFAFGSRVKGKFNETSDLDLGVLFDDSVSLDEALKISAKIESEISKKLNINAEVVPVNFSDLLFNYIAIKDSIFLAGNEMSYCAFKSLILREFFDFRILLKIHEKRIRKFFKVNKNE